jgi:hypothetical protein
MSVLSSRPALRWLAPAFAVLAILGGGAAIGALTANATPSLPPRTAAQLLVDLQTASLDGLSGTVVMRSDLGLPPIFGGSDGADLASVVSGTHTLRVWYSGAERVRLAVLGTLGETDVIRNGPDLWVWSSRDNRAEHRTLGAGAPDGDLAARLPLTPQQLADAALAAVEPSTRVSTDGSARVAGRDAYELVLAPRDNASLVDSVRLAIDAREHVPLRVRVYARAVAEPALEVAFTQISFARPDPDQFVFNPPPGTEIVEAPADDHARSEGAGSPDAESPKAGSGPRMARVGSGWTTVVVLRAPDLGAGTTERDDENADGRAGLAALLGALPRVSGAWGAGHVLSGKLFSALLTDDGRVLVGAVRPEVLVRAAADPAATLE